MATSRTDPLPRWHRTLADGRALLARGRWREAVACLTACPPPTEDDAAHHPRAAAAYWNLLGYALFRAGRHREALHCCEQALALCPDDLYARKGRATCLAACGEHDAAWAAFEDVLAREPDNPDTWRDYAVSLVNSGRVEAARAVVRRAREAAAGWDAFCRTHPLPPGLD